MKIKFNPDLDFQADAVASVVDLFEGQETCQTSFTVGGADLFRGPALPGMADYTDQSDLGIPSSSSTSRRASIPPRRAPRPSPR